MKAFIDHSLVRLLADGSVEEISLLKSCADANILKEGEPLLLIFGWPAFLEYIDLGFLFKKFPRFDEQNKLYTYLFAALNTSTPEEFLIELYDLIFAECLTNVKNLAQIDQTFLLNQIQKKEQSPSFLVAKDLFAYSLDGFKKLLIEDPYGAIHDLTLYLAWDRVCVNFALVFESPQVIDPKGLSILRECLIESFQHITEQGRTTPGFFRLLEALYAYEMREENLDKHTEEEWVTLAECAAALRPRDELGSAIYIDDTLVNAQELLTSTEEIEPLKTLTIDSPTKVRAGLSLAHHMIEKLKAQIPSWPYVLSPSEIVCLKQQSQGALSLNVVISL